MASTKTRDFSHVPNFTGYMKKIETWFSQRPAGIKVLDVPAGSGLMRDAIERYGHTVTCGDINKEREDYVYVDMNKPLPFSDSEFDAVICLEGIEHVINPVQLISELVRITKKDGSIIISTPNTTNMFSRLQFLFTGFLYQFSPAERAVVQPGEMKDRGHISPMSLYQLRYLFDYFGARLVDIDGDRFKRKIFFPVYLTIIALGRLWAGRLTDKHNRANPQSEYDISEFLSSPPSLFSRSIIMYLTKG